MIIDQEIIIYEIRKNFEILIEQQYEQPNLTRSTKLVFYADYLDEEINNAWKWFYSGYVTSLKNRYNKKQMY